jgi:hypothetical protein
LPRALSRFTGQKNLKAGCDDISTNQGMRLLSDVLFPMPDVVEQNALSYYYSGFHDGNDGITLLSYVKA